VTLTYDNGNRPTSLADTAGGTINWTYDNLGMLLSETSPQGSINYTNDNAGRRTGMTVTGGPSVTYSYDNAGRMTGIQQAGQAPITVAYDGAGRRSSMTLPNGMVAAYGYDGASRLTTLSYSNGATSIGSLAYLYDGADRPISISGSMAQTGLPVAASNGAYDAANQLTSWNGFPLSYDANGNLTNDGTNTYGWDARNRLTSITGATSATYQYDGLDRRALNPSGTRFLYDGAMAVTESQAGATVATYTAGPGVDEMLARTDSTGTQTFVVDGLGSTVALASNAGSMTTQYSYDAYGRTTASGGASANPFQYAGREADPSGLYYYRARYYSPALQRFISEDPLRFGGGDANFYSYASGNPAANTDPSGLGVVEQLKSSAQKVWAFRDRVVNFCQRKPEVVLITLGIIGEVIMEVGTVAEVAKTAPKLLNQFNDVDSLIQNAGKLARLKGGKLMGTVTGDGEAIFRAVSQGGETLSNGYVKMADGTIVGSHIASSTGEFTIDVNRAGQIFKIRVSQ
jgi:RHS repeat-associated protein